jgi:hypothetical protein
MGEAVSLSMRREGAAREVPACGGKERDGERERKWRESGERGGGVRVSIRILYFIWCKAEGRFGPAMGRFGSSGIADFLLT